MIAESMDELYFALVADVMANGQHRRPRGLPCLELRPGSFTIANAAAGLYTGASRRLNYRFWVAEAISYIAGWGGPDHAELLTAVNSKMAPFVNPATRSFDGAYGPLLARSMPAAITALRADPDTRRAVVPIWGPETAGGFTASLDVPCTVALHLYADEADGVAVLSMTAVMRSNDLNWGTPYDVAAFCAIQCLAADLLGMEPGRYHHYASSLHVYEATQPVIAPLPKEEFVVGLRLPRLGPAANTLWEEVAAEADIFCQSMLLHTRSGMSWKYFWPRLERGGTFFKYWSQWVDLVRLQR
jgi:thymidylate synthase